MKGDKTEFIQKIIILHTDKNKIGKGEFLNIKNEILFHEIYPNPASDIININYGNKDLNGQLIGINIYDSKGNLIKSEDTLFSSATTLDVSDLTSGIYYVRIKGDQKFNQKFIKK